MVKMTDIKLDIDMYWFKVAEWKRNLQHQLASYKDDSEKRLISKVDLEYPKDMTSIMITLLELKKLQWLKTCCQSIPKKSKINTFFIAETYSYI